LVLVELAVVLHPHLVIIQLVLPQQQLAVAVVAMEVLELVHQVVLAVVVHIQMVALALEHLVKEMLEEHLLVVVVVTMLLAVAVVQEQLVLQVRQVFWELAVLV
jgi:hypothetical protein